MPEIPGICRSEMTTSFASLQECEVPLRRWPLFRSEGQFERARGPTHFEPELRRQRPALALRKTGEEGWRQFCNLTLRLLPRQISYSSENASDGRSNLSVCPHRSHDVHERDFCCKGKAISFQTPWLESSANSIG